MESGSKAACAVACASLAALAAAFGCGGDTKGEAGDAGSSSGASGQSNDGSAGDAGDANASDGGPALVCATGANSSPTEGCNCGIGSAPVSGPTVATCPPVDLPFLCVAYDVPDPPSPSRHECECRTKCGQQSSASSSSGGPGPKLCVCGVASFLPLGGDGTTFEAIAACTLTTCCKGEGACDCSDAPAFACRPAQTKVATCTPDDFDEAKSLSVLFPLGSFENVTKVTRCK